MFAPVGELTVDSVERQLRRSGDLDLYGCSFLDPVGMVMAAMAADLASRHGQRTYRMPSDPAVARYLARMHFVRVVEEVTGLRPADAPPPFASYDRRNVLSELSALRPGENAGRPVADLVSQRLEGCGPAEEAFECVVEACSNVASHAGGTGYTAAQVYNRRGRWVHLAVGDVGQGVEASLRDEHGSHDDVGALRLVLERGASATGGFLGAGLRGIQAVVDGLGGRLVLRSGGAHAERRDKLVQISQGVDFPGTVLGIALPCQ